MKFRVMLPALALLWGIAGCGSQGVPAPLCRVVLAEGEGYRSEQYVQEVPRGESLSFTVLEEDGFTVVGCDEPDAVLTREADGMILTLPEVRYTQVVHLAVRRSDTRFRCFANGGTRTDGGDPSEPVEIPTANSHLRLNTPLGTGLFDWPGHTLLGWNTVADGSGISVGLGSRTDPNQPLYAQWSPWSDASLFRWEPAGDGAAITGYLGSEDRVTVPGELGGKPVEIIRAGAFREASCKEVVLPECLRTVEDGAFSGSALEALWMFDSIRDISDYAFQDCTALTVLHLNAAMPPVYSGTYYATFPDKTDRLISLAGQKKLILFSGSSARFGYDSAAIDQALPAYDVVNMGVFAYTNALPQLEIIRSFVVPGDILLHSPEFDAAQRQFCTSNNLDAPFFYMVEGNYDLLTLLDLRNYGQVFTPLHSFLVSRQGMPERPYRLSPADFDEDGNPSDTPSYNEYGDYILYRPNAAEDTPVYGLPVRYTPEAIPTEQFIAPLNRVYETFLDRGVRVLFTYAPRNAQAVSEDSTPEAIAALDAHLRAQLCVPVISSIQESLVRGTYLYGTDNHLSTEGVSIRTEQIIRDLKAALEQEDGHD